MPRSSVPRLSRLGRTIAWAAVAVLAVPLAPATGAAAAPAPAAPSWGACPPLPEGSERDERQQCATLSLPLDYRKPGGRTIDVAVSRITATQPEQRRGILLLNPGGPGGSGLDMPTFLAASLPAEVLARYDLVGFDPRGVGASTPITCGLDPATPAELVLPYPAPDGSIDRNVAFARAAAASCAEHAGDLLPYITTANTARDMDSIRAALGEPKLSYLGYSYGSYLGAVYTSLFPARSDRIILDSAVDPTKIWYGIWSQFSPAVALRFPDFTTWAAARDDTYGLGATPQAVRRTYFATAEALDREPVEGVSGNLFREITRSYLYDDTLFPLLAEVWQALAGATAPPAFATVRPTAAEVPLDNNIAVLWAVACDDVAWSGNVAKYARNVAADRQRFPITAGMPPNVWPCAFWHYQPVERPVAVTGDGPRNVLIFQNLRDPATGWESGYGLRRALGKRAAFVTQDAGGHGVYGIRAGECAIAIGTAFLVDGTLPARDRFCADGPTPDDVRVAAATGVQPPPVPNGPLGVTLR